MSGDKLYRTAGVRNPDTLAFVSRDIKDGGDDCASNSMSERREAEPGGVKE